MAQSILYIDENNERAKLNDPLDARDVLQNQPNLKWRKFVNLAANFRSNSKRYRIDIDSFEVDRRITSHWARIIALPKIYIHSIVSGDTIDFFPTARAIDPD